MQFYPQPVCSHLPDRNAQARASRRMPSHVQGGTTMKESHHEQKESRSVIRSLAVFFAIALAVGLYTTALAGSEEVKS